MSEAKFRLDVPSCGHAMLEVGCAYCDRLAACYLALAGVERPEEELTRLRAIEAAARKSILAQRAWTVTAEWANPEFDEWMGACDELESALGLKGEGE